MVKSWAFSAADGMAFALWYLTMSSKNDCMSAAENAQDQSAGLAQGVFATGKVAMVRRWSNEIAAQQAAVGQDCKILRLPSMTGNAKDADLYYKSSQFQSISSKSKNQVAAAHFLDYYFNNMDAGKVMLVERGLPPNTDVVAAIKPLLGNADQKAATYLSDLAPYLHDAPLLSLIHI